MVKTPSQRVKRIPSLKRFMSPLSILSQSFCLWLPLSLSLQTSGLPNLVKRTRQPLSLLLSWFWFQEASVLSKNCGVTRQQPIFQKWLSIQQLLFAMVLNKSYPSMTWLLETSWNWALEIWFQQMSSYLNHETFLFNSQVWLEKVMQSKSLL